MGRAEDLFERIRSGGVKEIDDLIAQRKQEDMFLDFKTSHRDGQDNTLNDRDETNLRRSISGFANAEGGVVVWGVNCDDKPHHQPLVDAERFAYEIQRNISRATIPPQRVEVAAIPLAGEKRGFVAMHVTKSFAGPVRTNQRNEYLVRAGESFVPILHDVLAGMFGRRPQPIVTVEIGGHNVHFDRKGGEDTIELPFALVLLNSGAVLAERAYVSLRAPRLKKLFARPVDDGTFPLRNSIAPGFQCIANEGVLLAPDTSVHLCDVHPHLRAGGVQRIEIEITCGARDTAPARMLLIAEGSAIEDAAQRVRNGANVRTDTVWKLHA